MAGFWLTPQFRKSPNKYIHLTSRYIGWVYSGKLVAKWPFLCGFLASHVKWARAALLVPHTHTGSRAGTRTSLSIQGTADDCIECRHASKALCISCLKYWCLSSGSIICKMQNIIVYCTVSEDLGFNICHCASVNMSIEKSEHGQLCRFFRNIITKNIKAPRSKE